MKPLISIIIPAHNAEKYIKEAVDSALVQTYENVEVIVVDDGSTDGTKNVLEPYVRDGKIKYVYQKNTGLAGARNAGIRTARGEYIAFLDADDLFLPEKVAEQVKVLEENPDYGVCYSDLTHFTDGQQRKFFHHRYHYPSGNLFELLLHKQFINPLTVFARRSVFEKYGMFDETLRRSEDWDLWLRWSHAGVKFFYLDKPLAYYRIASGGNLSSVESEPAMKEKNFFIFSRVGEKMSREEWQKYNLSAILGKLRLKTVFAHLMVGDKKSARRWSAESPWYWRGVISIVPATVWKFILGLARRAKHRLLLKKM
ncbi:MAG: glycosyltransferase [Candidatus Liptonbacteria bacterium]|nr:glycosyltransferase [Parcubacteria group bacterium]MBI4087368.1 glycosyltransferase [Candidatus Liptonbacteria bacterium]